MNALADLAERTSGGDGERALIRVAAALGGSGRSGDVGDDDGDAAAAFRGSRRPGASGARARGAGASAAGVATSARSHASAGGGGGAADAYTAPDRERMGAPMPRGDDVTRAGPPRAMSASVASAPGAGAPAAVRSGVTAAAPPSQQQRLPQRRPASAAQEAALAGAVSRRFAECSHGRGRELLHSYEAAEGGASARRGVARGVGDSGEYSR